jgi:hypothetical protein
MLVLNSSKNNYFLRCTFLSVFTNLCPYDKGIMAVLLHCSPLVGKAAAWSEGHHEVSGPLWGRIVAL